MNPNTGICGRKTGNICLIVLGGIDFIKAFNDKKYEHLPEHFKNDPVTLTYVMADIESHMMAQFGLKKYGIVLYKPKKAKYIAIGDDKLPKGITPSKVKKMVEDALTGNTAKWEKVQNANNDGLMFKEFVDK